MRHYRKRARNPLFPPQGLAELWDREEFCSAASDLGRLIPQGGWSCACGGGRSVAQLECPACGRRREGGTMAIGLPVVAHVSGSGEAERASFSSVYVEVRVGASVEIAVMQIDPHALEEIIYVAKLLLIKKAMNAAHRAERQRILSLDILPTSS